MSSRRGTVVSALTVSLCLASSLPAADTDEAAWDWSADNADKVARLLRRSLSIDEDEQGRALRLRWQVVVTNDDGFGLAWIAVVRRGWNGLVEAEALELVSRDLSGQLHDLRVQNPSISMESAKGLLVTSVCRRTSDGCAA